MKRVSFLKCGQVIVGNVEVATSLPDRLKGLLGRSSLGAGNGMYLDPCNSIHTILMKFSIDLVFLDDSLRVVKIVRDVKPGRMVFGGAAARSVLELESGWFPEDAVRKGDCLEMSGDGGSGADSKKKTGHREPIGF